MIQNEENGVSLMPNANYFDCDPDELFQDSPGVIGVQKVRRHECLARMISVAKQATQTTRRAAKTAIHKHPYKSLGIALGAGLVVGALASRKH